MKRILMIAKQIRKNKVEQGDQKRTWQSWIVNCFYLLCGKRHAVSVHANINARKGLPRRMPLPQENAFTPGEHCGNKISFSMYNEHQEGQNFLTRSSRSLGELSWVFLSRFATYEGSLNLIPPKWKPSGTLRIKLLENQRAFLTKAQFSVSDLKL